MNKKITVIIVDDHPLFREGVAQGLNRDPGIQVLAEGSNSDDARRLVASLSPDMILLDIGIPGGGLSTAEAIALHCPTTKIVMLTGSERHEDLVTALKVGARAYVLKGVSARELAAILKDVAGGANFVPPSLAANVLVGLTNYAAAPRPAPSILDELSDREHEILQLVSAGLSNREIGLQLHLSEKTIKHYMTYILQKLRVRNRTEAAMLAQRDRRPAALPNRS